MSEQIKTVNQNRNFDNIYYSSIKILHCLDNLLAYLFANYRAIISE